MHDIHTSEFKLIFLLFMIVFHNFIFLLSSLFEQESWGSGTNYDESKTKLLLEGSNHALREHVNCSSKRSGDQSKTICCFQEEVSVMLMLLLLLFKHTR